MKYLGFFKGSYILSFHGKDFLSAQKSRGIERFLWKLLMNSSDKITTCSESLKVEFSTFDEKVTQNIVSIHNGIDTSLSIDNTISCLEPCLQNKKFILNVATLEYKKGQDVLLKAFKEVSRNSTDLYLIIIGRPGGAETQIKQLIDSLGLSSRVFLYEGLTHDQVLAVMGRATIFVLPSRYEPFGIVTLESGVFGVPVIASNVGGIGEIITHNITGRLCESGDVYGFAKEIRYLLNSPMERERLGENLKIHVKKNFSWKNTYIKYIDCV
jgi:glycogen(starch) synthase